MQSSEGVRRGGAIVRFPGGIACDTDWQFPAITERHAFDRVKTLLAPSEDVCYLAFPWATLVDLLQTRKPRSNEFLAYLEQVADETRRHRRVVTVCQHIRQAQYVELLERAGVTDVFWSHATRGLARIGAGDAIRVYPFPLYPVQVLESADRIPIGERKHLFSFIGARANQWYLTQSRNHIIDLLASDPRGLVTSRDGWHYQKVVYDHQIHGTVDAAEASALEREAGEFRTAMAHSTFTLCPSGSGPNSIRLWEAIASGSIPVVLADTYQPPGDAALWEAATVTCGEDPESIQALPERLAAMAREPGLLERKLCAGRQLDFLYGRESFVYDVAKLYLGIAEEARLDTLPKHYAPSATMLSLLERTHRGEADAHERAAIARTLVSWSVLNPGGFSFQFERNRGLVDAIDVLRKSGQLDTDALACLREVLPPGRDARLAEIAS